MGERGAVTVEAALVLPLMVVALLGLIQLTTLQQAKLMTEYAAFCAARAGIVWNGSQEKMAEAALFALLPTFGRTDSARTLESTRQRARAGDQLLVESLTPFRVGGEEIDFDDNPTELEVRVRYLYELRIPLANAFLFNAWKWASRSESRENFIPLTATYRMRMESNLYRKWAP